MLKNQLMDSIKFTFASALLLIAISCESTSNEVDVSKDKEEVEHKDTARLADNQNDFEDYLELIPQLDLPLKFECETGFVPAIHVFYQSELIKKFLPEGATIIGKLTSGDNPKIIYGFPADIFFPMIYCYDEEGSILEELKVFELRDCVDSEFGSSRTAGEISKDLVLSRSLTLKDTRVLSNGEEKLDSIVYRDTVQIN